MSRFYTYLPFLACLFLCSSAEAQNQPGPTDPVITEDSELENMLSPQIREIKFPEEMTVKRQKEVSTPYEYHMESFDETPIHLRRNANTPAKLFIKGGAPVNNLEIWPEDAKEGDYPLIDATFRYSHIYEVNTKKLPDGNYKLRVVYNNREVETSLEIRSDAPH